MASLARNRGVVVRFAQRHLASLAREPTVVGLKADPNPRETLKKLYQKTLSAVQEFPESAAYRRNVTAVSEYRLGVVESESNVDEIERLLGIGQIEEIIEQANDELELIPFMAKWKPWATESGVPPAKIEVTD